VRNRAFSSMERERLAPDNRQLSALVSHTTQARVPDDERDYTHAERSAFGVSPDPVANDRFVGRVTVIEHAARGSRRPVCPIRRGA
jgi:hypothetical protein